MFLLLISAATTSYAQVNPKSSITITGVILDEMDEPVTGATIIDKSTSNGTISDIDGKFELKTY